MYILSILYISSSEELPNDVYIFVILSYKHEHVLNITTNEPIINDFFHYELKKGR
jgi:hypothetical protein